MNQQLAKPSCQGQPGALGFSGRCFYRNNDITKQSWRDITERALTHGESNYVGRPITVEIVPIDDGYLEIIHQNKGQFDVRIVQGV